MSDIGFHVLSGRPYDVGRALGQCGAPAVRGYLVATAAWRGVMARKADGRVAAMISLVRAAFPAYAEELHGLADGLDLPFDEVFAWNCRGELWAMTQDGCTTVQLPGREQRIIAHNEDGLPGLAGQCFMARIRIESARAFISFVYPGSLPGHSFALSESGLTATVNNLRPLGAALGLPRMILSRAMLDAPDIDAAISLVSESPRAGAFHVTLGQSGDSRIMSVEFCHAGVVSVPVIEPSIHANHFIRSAFSTLPQRITPSSAARQTRGEALVTAGRDPLDILRDRDHPTLPILRLSPEDPDHEKTLATARITIGQHDSRCEVFAAGETRPGFDFDHRLEPRSRQIADNCCGSSQHLRQPLD